MSTIRIKQDGGWIESNRPFLKTNGSWQEQCAAFTKVEGSWVHTFQCEQQFIMGNEENVNLGQWLLARNANPNIAVRVTLEEGAIVGGTVHGGAALYGGNLPYPKVTFAYAGTVQGKGGDASHPAGSPAVWTDTPIHFEWLGNVGGWIAGGGGAGGAGGTGGYGEGTNQSYLKQPDNMYWWKGVRVKNSPKTFWATAQEAGYNSYWTPYDDEINRSLGHAGQYDYLGAYRNNNGSGTNYCEGEFAGTNYEWTMFRRDQVEFTDVSESKHYLVGGYMRGARVSDRGVGGTGGVGQGYQQDMTSGSSGTSGQSRYGAGSGGQGGSGGDYNANGTTGGQGGSGVRWKRRSLSSNASWLPNNNDDVWRFSRTSDDCDGQPGTEGGVGGKSYVGPVDDNDQISGLVGPDGLTSDAIGDPVSFPFAPVIVDIDDA